MRQNINRRAMLIPFQLALGGDDVAKILSILGLYGSSSMERNFSRNSKEIMAAIQDECDKIITDWLKHEIIETLKCKKDKWSTEIMVLVTNEITKNKVNDLPIVLGDLRLTFFLRYELAEKCRRAENTTRCLGMASLSAV